MNTNDEITSIDVIIVTYNSTKILSKCLDKLDGVLIKKIYIVDNASTDQIEELLKLSSIRDKITLIKNKNNLGFAKAISIGVQHSAANKLLILNPDCEITETFLQNIIHCHQLGADLVCPKLFYNQNGQSMPGLMENPSTRALSLQVLAYQLSKKMPIKSIGQIIFNLSNRFIEKYIAIEKNKKKTQWFWPHGACFSITKAIYIQAGGMPESYFMYNEDVEFGYHLTNRGCSYAITQDHLFHAHQGGSDISSKARMDLILSSHKIYLSRVKTFFK
jgi:GT2 family glycosyltransferase